MTQPLKPLNPIQDGEGKKASPPPTPPPTSFSLVTFANVGISTKNCLTFSFTSFATLV